MDLPRHVGSSRALDAAISAFVAGFGTMRNRTAPKLKALDRYVDALGTLREAISDPKQANSLDNMCAIYLIAICQVSVSEHVTRSCVDVLFRNGWEIAMIMRSTTKFWETC